MPQQRWVPNGGERRVMKTRRSRRAGRGGTIEVAGFVRVTGWLEGIGQENACEKLIPQGQAGGGV
jgi:hypothetical protein